MKLVIFQSTAIKKFLMGVETVSCITFINSSLFYIIPSVSLHVSSLSVCPFFAYIFISHTILFCSNNCATTSCINCYFVHSIILSCRVIPVTNSNILFKLLTHPCVKIVCKLLSTLSFRSFLLLIFLFIKLLFTA